MCTEIPYNTNFGRDNETILAKCQTHIKNFMDNILANACSCKLLFILCILSARSTAGQYFNILGIS